MKWKLIVSVILVAAVIIGFNLGIRWVNAQHMQDNEAWNARIDQAGLRRASPEQVMGYLRHEHLPFHVYHEDLSLIIVKAEPGYWFSLSDGFIKTGQKVQITFQEPGRLDCYVVPMFPDEVWTKQSPETIPASARRFLN
jgi:hypothetical protein